MTSSGRATGRKTIVPTISITSSPTARATSPFAMPAIFGMNGAPAANPSNSRPSANGSSNRSNRAMPSASNGAMMKFANSAKTTSLTFRSGDTICCSLSPRPISDMLETRKTKTESRATAAKNSVTGGLSFKR